MQLLTISWSQSSQPHLQPLLYPMHMMPGPQTGSMLRNFCVLYFMFLFILVGILIAGSLLFFFSSCLTVTILEHTYNEALFNLRLLYSNAITLQRFSSFNPQTTFLKGFDFPPIYRWRNENSERKINYHSYIATASECVCSNLGLLILSLELFLLSSAA